MRHTENIMLLMLKNSKLAYENKKDSYKKAYATDPEKFKEASKKAYANDPEKFKRGFKESLCE